MSNNPPDIATALALLAQEVRQNTDEARRGRELQEKVNADIENRIRALETTTTKLGERLSLYQAAQAIWTIIIGTLAAYLGKQP